jgi:hypothetical protein
VTDTGVGFFDFQHGQTEVEPKAIELQPSSASPLNPAGLGFRMDDQHLVDRLCRAALGSDHG